MTLLKKISLIIIGIIFSLIVLEIGLQTAGFTLTAIKKYKNKTIKDPNTITILCLGESTTDGKWPPVLQKILDKESKNKKFNVIDEGINATNTRKIAEKISDNLIKYNPDIVIMMMGINDIGLGYTNYKIKVLALFSLIVSNIKQIFYYTNEDMEYLDRIINEIPLDKKIKISYRIYKKTGVLYHNLSSQLIEHIINTEYNSENKKLINLTDKILNIEKHIRYYALPNVITYLKIIKHYDKEQIKEFIIKNKNRIEYGKNSTEQILEEYDLLYLLNDIKNNKLDVSYKNIKESKNLKKDNTKKNYQYIISEVYKNNKNSLVIPMQYPTLSVEKLRQDLKDSSYYDKLIFISNEENFKQALQQYKTEDIFTDMFGGTFGHCTKLGNTLIAENVAETILNLYN
jgi:lysophospholipase L1-like esterase